MNTFQAYQLITASPHMREMLNGFLFVLCLNLSIMIWHVMYQTWKTEGDGWATASGIPSACALAWVFGIFGFRSFLVWLILWCSNRGIALPLWFEQFGNAALIVSAIGLALATLRCTYVFSPPAWGNQPWAASVLSAGLFTIAASMM